MSKETTVTPAINHRFFKDTAHIGFIIFPRNAKSPHAARSPTDSRLTHYLYTVPVSYTTPRVATSPPELHGSIQTELDSPNFYLPSRVPVITEREAQQLETTIPMDTKKLDSISTRVLAQKQTYDVDSLFQQHRSYMQHEEQTQW